LFPRSFENPSFDIGPAFDGNHLGWIPSGNVTKLITEMWTSKSPNSQISHIFGSKAAQRVTLAEVYAIQFGKLHMSENLMAKCLLRLCSQQRAVHFLHPDVWRKADLTMNRFDGQCNAATDVDVSAVVEAIPADTNTVVFPFVTSSAWVLCVFFRDPPVMLLSHPNNLLLPCHAISFLKGYMDVFSNPRNRDDSTISFRRFPFNCDRGDSGFIILHMCYFLLKSGTRDLSTLNLNGEDARTFCAAHLAGEYRN